MKISSLLPAVQDRFEFSYEFHKFVPILSGCYALTTFDGHILYIGLTDDLHRRFAEHRSNKDKCSLTAQGKSFWFYYLTLEKAELYRIERTWLNSHMDEHGELPILNKINSPII